MSLYVRTGTAGTDPDYFIADLGHLIETGATFVELTKGDVTDPSGGAGQFDVRELRESTDLYFGIRDGYLEASTDGATNNIAALAYSADLSLTEELSDDLLGTGAYSHSGLTDLATGDDHPQYFNDVRLNPLLDGYTTDAEFSAHTGDATVHFTEASIDHGNLAGLLTDDDHTQYAFLAGRAGGQSWSGGTAASQEIALRGTTNANLGQIRMQSPIRFDDVSAANALSSHSIIDQSTQNYTGGFVGGFISASPTIGFSASTFIWEALRGAPIITSGVSPAFAAFTLFQALPTMHAGTGATHNPLNITVMNAGTVMSNPVAAATRTAGINQCISFAPQVRASGAGSTMSVTTQTAVRLTPTFSTVAGTTANLGTIRGLHCYNPAIGFFQPGGGVETLTAYYGLDFAVMPFGGNVDKVVVRSALGQASNSYFLQNNGGAQSDFGGSNLLDCGVVQLLGDGIASSLSLGAAGGDMLIYWDGVAEVHDPLIGPDIRWTPNAAALDYWTVSGSLARQGIQFDLETIEFGVNAANPLFANYFVRFVGPNNRPVQFAGVYSDVWWTGGGLIDVAGFAMTELSAMRIDTPTTVLNGGSVGDQNTLHVAGMPFTGGAATRRQALKVLGRSRFDGLMNHNEATLAQLTADVAALSLPITNSGRHIIMQDSDALGPWTIQGVINTQPGDSFYIINNGSENYLLGHQDGAAAAADRIICPQGADLILRPDEAAKLWYDPVATRWRILEHTGNTPSTAYTPTNVSTDRSYDANSTTTDELADVLGTLIADLQANGTLG